MKRKIMAVLTATVVAFGGVVVAGAPAQAASCTFTVYTNTPGYAKAYNESCSAVRAKLECRIQATGSTGVAFGPWAGYGRTSQTGSVTASWVTARGAQFVV